MDTLPAPYAARLALLDQLGLALWDVAASAERQASADATMRRVETGDFQTLYRRHPAICRVCFNGRTAETLYRRHVLPGLPEDIRTRLMHHPALPSTSPAHAAMSLAEKKREMAGRTSSRKAANFRQFSSAFVAPHLLAQIVDRNQLVALINMPEGPAIAALCTLRGGAHLMN